MTRSVSIVRALALFLVSTMVVTSYPGPAAAASVVLYNEPFNSLSGWTLLPASVDNFGLNMSSGIACVYESTGSCNVPAYARHTLSLASWSGTSDLSLTVRFEATSTYSGSSQVTHFRVGIMDSSGNILWSYYYYETYSADTGWETKSVTISRTAVPVSNNLYIYFGFHDSWSTNWQNQAYCDYITIRGGLSNTPPAQVTGLTVYGVSNSVALITWNPNTEADLKEYYVYRRGVTMDTKQGIAVVPKTECRYVDPTIVRNSHLGPMYYYTISAVDSLLFEGQQSDEQGGLIQGTSPSKVTGLVATGVSGLEIQLDWTRNTEPDLSRYDVFRFSYSTCTYEKIGQTSSGTNHYSDLNPKEVNELWEESDPLQTWFTYRVCAVDLAGLVGEMSDPASSALSDSRTAVRITNIPPGCTLKGSFVVIASATGTFDRVRCTVGPENRIMSRIGLTNQYECTIPTLSDREYTLTVRLEDSDGNPIPDQMDSVPVTVVSSYSNWLYLEVDCVDGYYPSSINGANELDYIVRYYASMGIGVNYVINDTDLVDPSPDGMISDADFWILENQSNNWQFGIPNQDDRAHGVADQAKLNKTEKYILFCSRDAAYPTVKGFTRCEMEMDFKNTLCGNYIRIYQDLIRDLEQALFMTSGSAEVMVLMHELGHAIGIGYGDVPPGGVFSSEYYGCNRHNVMFLARLENTKLVYGFWYYDRDCWAQKNY